MKTLVLKKNVETFGPNCWNSVLFLNGMSPGLGYSTVEMEFWLASPLCKVISPGNPQPGDIVNFSRKGLTSHVFRFMSDKMIFNKDSPSEFDPYEILNFKEYLAKQKFEARCQNVRPEVAATMNCKVPGEYSIYRCENFEDYVQGLATPEMNEAKASLKKASNCFTAIALGTRSDDTPKSMRDLALVVKTYAHQELKFPLASEVSEEFNSEWKKINRGQAINQDDLTYYSILSQHDMEASVQAPLDKQKIELIRQFKLYDYSPTKDFLMWSQIYLTGQNLQESFEEDILE